MYIILIRQTMSKKSVHPDNFWIRNCRFESGILGVLTDGVFNGGVLDCYFGPEITSAHISGLRNSDMNIAKNMWSPLLRVNRYIVFTGNNFEGANANRGRAIAGNYSATLATHNQCRNLRLFVRFAGWFPTIGRTATRPAMFE